MVPPAGYPAHLPDGTFSRKMLGEHGLSNESKASENE
jgi:hypothetical protein